MGCGEGERWHFLALWQKEMYLLPSLLLVGDFCRNRVFSLNIRPSVTDRGANTERMYVTERMFTERMFGILQNPKHTFLPCVPKFMSDILCGVWHA